MALDILVHAITETIYFNSKHSYHDVIIAALNNRVGLAVRELSDDNIIDLN